MTSLPYPCMGRSARCALWVATPHARCAACAEARRIDAGGLPRLAQAVIDGPVLDPRIPLGELRILTPWRTP